MIGKPLPLVLIIIALMSCKDEVQEPNPCQNNRDAIINISNLSDSTLYVVSIVHRCDVEIHGYEELYGEMKANEMREHQSNGDYFEIIVLEHASVTIPITKQLHTVNIRMLGDRISIDFF